MLNMKTRLAAAAALAMVIGTPAMASVTFQLVDYNGSVTGTAAAQGFKIATDYWASVLTTSADVGDVTVRLETGYNPLATGVIGSTGSTRYLVGTSDIYEQLGATGVGALDAKANASLSPLTAAGDLQAITSGYGNPATKLGVDWTTKIFDNDDSLNNTQMVVNGATLKALGYTGFNPAQRDAQVNFSSNFAFDFNPTDGITAGTFDFIGVAIHEIGHALGFVSGVDQYDTGSATGFNRDAGGAGGFSTLDLFRYSADSTNIAPGTGPALDLAVGSAAYFSIDGGQTQFNGSSLFSTGRNRGDGQQASHFKDLGGCTGQIGIMDPNFCFGQMGEVSATDLAAFDALGWNLKFDVLANTGYKVTSADIYTQFAQSVPEPTTWAMMLVGFGVIGGAMRRRGKVKTTVSYA
ncbi:NF038122 family metalloprotease [Sphingomonas endolithica]|uniref:NF038122 family metalloprotease n=1 Tax=Sphingomonas endolithica TaxID=2972485 RepID=UPI0021AE3907|nr:NF038122 family metalloprotease [Sphingomonas sp. ZFBP2030]